MNPEGWRGSDALNNNDVAENFWAMTLRRASPDEVKEGDVITAEYSKEGEVMLSRVVRVSQIVEDAKGRHVQFEDATPEQAKSHSGLLMVISL